MTRLLFTAILCVLAVQLSPGDQLSPSDVKTLLAKIRERRAAAPDMQADFQEQKAIRLMNKPLVSSGKVWFQAPNKFRREVRGNSPSVTVSNGTELWIYYPAFKSAEHYSLGKRSPVDTAIAAINTALNIEGVETTFHVTGARVNNGYELELTPRAASMKRMFQKFELHLNNDFLAEKTDMVQPNGDRTITTYTNQSQSTIPRSTFEFSPPAGTEVTRPLGR